MFRKSKGRKRVNGEKVLVKNKIGRNPTIAAENKEALSLLEIFFPMKKMIMVKVLNNKLGRILATSSIGRSRLNKAIK